MKYDEKTISKEFRAKLTILFREARKLGANAKRNHLCCGGCASYDLNQNSKEGQPVLYYHHQDAEGIKRGGLYLGHGCATHRKSFKSKEKEKAYDKAKEQQELIFAHAICNIAREAGLEVNWEGDTYKRIWVGLFKEGEYEGRGRI